MVANIIVGACTVIAIAAGIWAWKVENGSSKKDKKDENKK